MKYGSAPARKKNSPSAGRLVPSRLSELVTAAGVSPLAGKVIDGAKLTS